MKTIIRLIKKKISHVEKEKRKWNIGNIRESIIYKQRKATKKKKLEEVEVVRKERKIN